MKAKLIVVVTLIVLALGVCSGTIGVLLFIVQTIWYLVTGWIYFILRNVGRASPNAGAAITGLIAFVLLALVVHRMLRRIPSTPFDTTTAPTRISIRTSAAVVALIAFLFVAGVSAIAITHQTFWMFSSNEPVVRSGGGIREASDRIKSQYNLKRIGIAFHNHADESSHEAFPCAGTMNSDGRVLHSWQTHLLPYMESTPYYAALDLKKPWNDPVNQDVFRNELKFYRHPRVDQRFDSNGYAITTYSANIRALSFAGPTRIDQYPRGASNTILVGEAAGNYKPWGYPLNVRDLRLGLNKSHDGFGGPWKYGTHLLMADGSVRTFTNDADPKFLELMANGRE